MIVNQVTFLHSENIKKIDCGEMVLRPLAMGQVA
jgi:hypothetical protein